MGWSLCMFATKQHSKDEEEITTTVFISENQQILQPVNSSGSRKSHRVCGLTSFFPCWSTVGD